MTYTICNVEYMPIIDAEKDDLVWEDMIQQALKRATKTTDTT